MILITITAIAAIADFLAICMVADLSENHEMAICLLVFTVSTAWIALFSKANNWFEFEQED